MNYLKHLDDYSDQDYDDYHKQGIIYLYLWLYNYEVKNKLCNGNTKINLKNIMDLYESKSESQENIHNVYKNDIMKIIHDELNDLFYLYEKFHNFQNNEECTADKCKCAKECVDAYKNSADKCNNYGNMYFCNELENFRKKYNEYKPTVTECQEVQSYLPSYRKFSTSVIILISFITISVLSSLLFILYKVITIFIYLFIVQ
ncbi:hypothetical protein PVIIG_05791 [Plasmodium vivax India VII]|uniref:Variable surface protein n=1 Tax=Plasmodium vivax India VII TaxID=1077284 RepID=A0A0J9SHJ7_PLAVI|nr:hypothetical protein PVIIG_05791 [Plasmodium vivax India VII]